MAEGGVPELVALVARRTWSSWRRVSSSATRRLRPATSASRSRHPGHVTVAMIPSWQEGQPAPAPQSRVNGYPLFGVVSPLWLPAYFRRKGRILYLFVLGNNGHSSNDHT